MDIMYDRKSGARYEVFHIDMIQRVALCFNSNVAKKNNGVGWVQIRLNNLIPEKYFNPSKGCYMSIHERNRAKKHLSLLDATWQTEDGRKYPHSMIEEAIAHQLDLLKDSDEEFVPEQESDVDYDDLMS